MPHNKTSSQQESELKMEPKCSYCGCKNPECLARCVQTGYYFCNSKQKTIQSHIIYHLRSIQGTQISLPPENPFSQTDLRCYICGSTNIFRLGLIFSEENQIYIVCRSPCQFDEALADKKICNNSFMPIVSNNEIIPAFVKIPKDDECQNVPMTKIVEVKEQMKMLVGQNGKVNGQNCQVYGAKLRYNSVDEYVNIMSNFVSNEKEESANLEIVRKFNGISFEWVDEFNVKFKAQPQLYKLANLGASINFSVNDITEVGYVYGRSNNMTICVHFHDKPSFFDKRNGITLNVINSDIPFKRQMYALQSLRNPHIPFHWLILDLFLGCTEKIRHHNKIRGKTGKFYQPPNIPSLNSYQRHACEVALSQRFTMIQGPPGTGKTTVISALVYSFVKSNFKPILVCAQSNVAADFATLKISQLGLNVTRVLSTSREAVDTTIASLTTRKKALERHGESFSKLLESSDKEDSRKATAIEKEIIEKSDVVCATCTSSGGARLKGVNFQAVIFDEAGQCLDPDLLIALSHNAQQAILVGDHCQLGPVVLSKENVRNRYDLPLMQRLILDEVKPIILRTQYRMHSAISSFPSEAFYQNLLNNGVKDEDRKWAKDVINWPNPNKPIIFWNVHSKEEYYDFGLSYLNTSECIVISSIIQKMYSNDVKASDIGIITPYVGQQTYLIETLPILCKDIPNEFFEDLEIASVDAFQGREKNFIIFSCVRANDSFDIGFLRDKRRLCVSLTRSKYGLITVGNAATFAHNPLWCKFIEHCASNKVFVEGNTVDSLSESSFTPLVTTEENEDENDFVDVNDEIA